VTRRDVECHHVSAHVRRPGCLLLHPISLLLQVDQVLVEARAERGAPAEGERARGTAASALACCSCVLRVRVFAQGDVRALRTVVHWLVLARRARACWGWSCPTVSGEWRCAPTGGHTREEDTRCRGDTAHEHCRPQELRTDNSTTSDCTRLVGILNALSVPP
jgi:hypothetical protein